MASIAPALRATTLSTPPFSKSIADPWPRRRRTVDEQRDCHNKNHHHRRRRRRHSSVAASTSSPSSSSPSSSTSKSTTDEYYDSALAKARECIFNHPPGQLLGRAGRRCTLEDGERHALRAISARPAASSKARVLLARSLVEQSRGRELEVPLIALKAMRETESGALSAEDAAALVEAAGVAFEDKNRGAIIEGATTGFRSVREFAEAVVEAAPAGEREAVVAAAAAVVARVEKRV